MKMINTPAAVLPTVYPSYVHNCKRNRACEPGYLAPLPGVPYLQLYVEFGTTKPVTMDFEIIDTCTGNIEQIFPSNYVAGKTPDGTWYGVFKYFNTPALPVTSFVVWLSSFVQVGDTLQEKTFFSEMLVVEPCAPLMKIKACQPEGATTTGFDTNDVYYGLPTNLDYLGISAIRFFHIAYVRLGKVRELSNKATFKSSLVANFRTIVEKIHQLETELVPKWYKNELLAIYARGAVQIDDVKTWIVSELAFEALNDDDLTWKPFAQLKETFRLYFGCDDSECVECCSPIVLSAFVTSDAESASGSVSESVSASASEPPPEEGGEFRVWANLTGVIIGNITGITNDITYPVVDALIVGNWSVYPGGNINVPVSNTAEQDGDVVLSVNGVIRHSLPLAGDDTYIFLAANVGTINVGDIVQIRVRP